MSASVKHSSPTAGNCLIVDDEPDLCWAMKHILDLSGISATIAQSGGEALALMHRHSFELVFMDAKLPDVDGLVLARQIREIDPTVHVLLVSGYFYRHDHVIQRALDEGIISGFIAKPFVHCDIFSIANSVGKLHPNREPAL